MPNFLNNTTLTHEKKVNVLYSYYYNQECRIEDTVQKTGKYVSHFMLDSGGFSTRNMPENERENLRMNFINYIKNRQETHNDFKCIFAYDDLKESVDVNINYFDELHGLYSGIVPIIHDLDEPDYEITAYLSYKPEIIAIGQANNGKKERNAKRLKSVIDKIRSNKKDIKIHLLGITKLETLLEVDFDTCDSKSYLDCAISGIVMYFNEKTGKELIYFPNKENKKKSGTVLLDDASHKQDFLNDMEKVFKLRREDFFNNNAQKNRTLANIYYTIQIENYLKNPTIFKK